MQWKDGAPRVTFLTDFIEDISSYCYISARDIVVCLFLGVAFTILRYFLTAAAFKPYFRWCQLRERDVKKSSESAFKLLFYSLVFGYCSYILFNGNYNFYHDTSNCWKGWYKGMPVPQDIYMLYVVEAGFYFHSVYATLFMDLWRRDSVLMIAHHIVANLLILFSFAMRYHSIGLLVLFVHDPTDIILEFTKLCVAFKSRGGKYHLLPDVISVVGFLSFALAWFYCRLYIFPIKVLYSCGCISLLFLPQVPLYFFFNAMIWLLFLMDIWWFHFIVLLIIRIAVGKSSGVEDTREIPKDSVKGEEHGEVANGKVLQNGELHNCASHIEATHTKAGQRKYNKEGIKKGEPNQNCDKQKDNEEPGFRRRWPRTKPANP